MADICKEGSKYPSAIQFGDIARPDDDVVLAEEEICSIKLATEAI